MSDALETPVVELTEDQKNHAKQRAGECFKEIQDILGKYKCRIVPFLVPSTELGSDPVDEIAIRASYGVMPEVV